MSLHAADPCQSILPSFGEFLLILKNSSWESPILKSISQPTCPNSCLSLIYWLSVILHRTPSKIFSCQVAEFKPRSVTVPKLVSVSNASLHWCFIAIYLIPSNQVKMRSCLFTITAPGSTVCLECM